MEIAARGAATIRLATSEDCEVINEIYNHYVLTSTCTYQLEPEPIAARREWLARHGEQHPVTVAILDGAVVGWGSLSPWNSRAGYRRSVESSVYLRHDVHRRGLGRALLADLIARARALGHHTVIAGIDAEQTASLALHRDAGMVEVARFREVGNKFDRWLDVIYLQLSLGE